MSKNFLLIGALLGALSVLLGAFAAHSLKNHLDADQIEIFQTGVRYQFYHTFAILILGVVMIHYQHHFLKYSGWFFMLGILLFSGSLYLFSSRFALGIESWKWLGPVTPIGGLFLVVGWILFFIGIKNTMIN